MAADITTKLPSLPDSVGIEDALDSLHGPRLDVVRNTCRGRRVDHGLNVISRPERCNRAASDTDSEDCVKEFLFFANCKSIPTR